MHLTIVSPYPPSITGIGQYGYHVSRLLAQSSLFSRITVVTGRPTVRREVKTPLPIHIQPTWQPESPVTGWEIALQLQKLKPDLVWFNLGASVFGRSPLANVSGFLGPGWGRRLGIPTVVTLHELAELADLRALRAPGGPFAAYGAHLLTGMALQADVVCLTMRRYAEWLATRQPYLPCAHIPIGAYHPPEILAAGGSRELLFFTTLAPFKGLEILLEAFRSLRETYPDLHLTIAGVEHARFPDYARELRQTLQAMDGVHLRGEVPEENVRELFHRAGIVILPYTTSTGSSSVLYQAATWGRSIVASDLAETRTIANESSLDVTFFRNNDAASLAAAIRTHLDSPERCRRQVEHNFAAIQHNRPEETCRAYLDAFNRALEIRRSPKRIGIPAKLTLEPA